MAKPKSKKQAAPAVEILDETQATDSDAAEDAAEKAREQMEAKLEFIAEMLKLAESIVAELKNGETVEKLEDADTAIEEARDFARQLLALEPSS